MDEIDNKTFDVKVQGFWFEETYCLAYKHILHSPVSTYSSVQPIMATYQTSFSVAWFTQRAPSDLFQPDNGDLWRHA